MQGKNLTPAERDIPRASLDDFIQKGQRFATEWMKVGKAYGTDIIEEANRAEMLDEAAERMKMLGLPEDAISEFQNSGHPSFGIDRKSVV